jgi:hypothetical protein
MILQRKMAFEYGAESRPLLEFAARDHLLPVLIAVVGGEYTYPVEDKFQFAPVADDLCMVPFSRAERHAFFAGDQVIEIACTVFIDLAIRVPIIIQHLHFRTGMISLFEFGAVFLRPEDQAAVAVLGNLPVVFK